MKLLISAAAGSVTPKATVGAVVADIIDLTPIFGI
jgi:hypothetical protein